MPAEFPAEQARAGLQVLQEAYEFAQETGSDVWDFAVERATLQVAGLTANYLRRLLATGLAEHALELRHPDNARRPVRKTNSFRFRDDSCFVLTAGGFEYSRRSSGVSPSTATANSPAARATEPGQPPPSAKLPIPQWDRKNCRLTFDGEICMIFKRAAINAELVLHTFEAACWLSEIPDPIPPDKLGNHKRRHHNTIAWLNSHQRPIRIHFASANGGEAIRWTVVSPPVAKPSRVASRRERRR